MARKSFKLDVDPDKQTDKECKEKDPTTGNDKNATKVILEDYLNALDDGKLKQIGTIYRGAENLLSTETQQSTTLAGSCIYLYIGGTCYKICN